MVVLILESEDLPTASGLHIVTNDDYRVQKEKGQISLFFLEDSSFEDGSFFSLIFDNLITILNQN